MLPRFFGQQADEKSEALTTGSPQQTPSYGTTIPPTPKPRKVIRTFIRNPTATSTIPGPEDVGLGHRVKRPQKFPETPESEKSPASSSSSSSSTPQWEGSEKSRYEASMSTQTVAKEQAQHMNPQAPNYQAAIPSSFMNPVGVNAPSMNNITNNPGNVCVPHKITRRNSMVTERASRTEATETQPLLRRKSNPNLHSLNQNSQPAGNHHFDTRRRRLEERSQHLNKVDAQLEEGLMEGDTEREMCMGSRMSWGLIILAAALFVVFANILPVHGTEICHGKIYRGINFDTFKRISPAGEEVCTIQRRPTHSSNLAQKTGVTCTSSIRSTETGATCYFIPLTRSIINSGYFRQLAEDAWVCGPGFKQLFGMPGSKPTCVHWSRPDPTCWYEWAQEIDNATSTSSPVMEKIQCAPENKKSCTQVGDPSELRLNHCCGVFYNDTLGRFLWQNCTLHDDLLLVE
ncbi:hypothetical protein HYFRA_00003691 [Hymenoscyphus fraxineus]|uniref:Uncharacterized protein n=1 Tax=Hymenoscyphus fraxineus TaxID=746836 RepID=A0A9N9L0C2_9HELO|nr:hypothetical protein HYFRA_00003691 [Hymenoscyphus fraxineus]